MKKVIMIDLGGVLYKDESVECFFLFNCYNQILKFKPSLSLEEFFNYREHYYPSLKNNWIKPLIFNSCQDNITVDKIIHHSWHMTLQSFPILFHLYSGAYSFVASLKKMTKIICAANQPLKALDKINSDGIAELFDAIYLDSIIGHSKPNIDFFYYILNREHLHTKDIIYIGDRSDNDYEPCKSLGIEFIGMRFNISKPENGLMTDHFIFKYITSIKKIWHQLSEHENCLAFNSYGALLNHIKQEYLL